MALKLTISDKNYLTSRISAIVISNSQNVRRFIKIQDSMFVDKRKYKVHLPRSAKLETDYQCLATATKFLL